MADPTAPPRPVDLATLERIGRDLLVALGEDPDRDGLTDTPARWARWWAEFVDHDPGRVATAFDTVTVDQIVAVTGVRVWSLCEHHLLPFRVDLTMAYVAGSHLLGLSKFARIANAHAHRLQVQERLVAGIADDIAAATGSPSVAVVGRGEHLCMTMRGVRTPATMVTSEMRGIFRDQPESRAEVLALAP